jgi:hypothetical protein
MGVRDSGGLDVILSSEELSNYFSPLGEDDAPMETVTLLLLMDFSKAFDIVRHSLLLRKLSLYGGTAVALVGSYLSDRYQCASLGGILSELIAVTRGVM